MFSKSKKISNIILLLSAYIPLYLVILIQNIFSFITSLNETETKVKNIKGFFSFVEVWIISICLLLTLIILLMLKRILNNTKRTNDSLTYEIKVISIKNNGHEYLTSYLAVYILPFITLNLTTLAGLTQFGVLFFMIGYLYLKYEMIYVNPTLNILFKVNTYNIEYENLDNKKTYKTILLSTNEEEALVSKKITVRGDKLLVHALNKKGKL